MVKNPLAMWKTWVQSLGWEDPLEKGMATVSLILFMTPNVLLFTLSAPFLEPRIGKAQAKRLKKTQGAIGTADAFIISWLSRQPSQGLSPG